MTGSRHHDALLAAMLLALVAGPMVSRCFAESTDRRLTDLLSGTGLKFVQPDENGVAEVLFRGESIPTIEIMVGISGKMPLETVLIAVEVARRPSNGWDARLLWDLLRRNSTLIRGHFAISSDNQALYYMDTPPLQGLDSQTLARLLEFAAIVVYDTYHNTGSQLRGADPGGEATQ